MAGVAGRWHDNHHTLVPAAFAAPARKVRALTGRPAAAFASPRASSVAAALRNPGDYLFRNFPGGVFADAPVEDGWGKVRVRHAETGRLGI